MLKLDLQFFGGRGGASGSTSSPNSGGFDMSSQVLPAIDRGKPITVARKNEAMYELGKIADNLTSYDGPRKEEWQLAELKKYGTVRITKDKQLNDWITTTYGTINGKSGYYGLNVRTGKMVSSADAERIYHRSRA